MQGTTILQGSFTSTGNAVNLAIPSSANWMYVYNYTALAQAAADLSGIFYWQLGMAPGTGLYQQKLGTEPLLPLTAGALAAPNGFTILDQNDAFADPNAQPIVGPSVALSAISNNVHPEITVASTAGYSSGVVLRLSMTPTQVSANPSNILSIDMQVNVTDGTHFTVANALEQAPGAAGGAGSFRVVNIDSIFYPKTRYIVNITQAVNAVVTTSVNHGYVAGQLVRINVPNSLNGMTQINGQVVTITAVTASTFTINLNTTGYSAFAFPTIAALTIAGGGIIPYTFAFADPVGQDTAYSLANNLNTLADAVFNEAIIGMTLGGGAAMGDNAGPAGSVGDVMYWVAGRSEAIFNS